LEIVEDAQVVSSRYLNQRLLVRNIVNIANGEQSDSYPIFENTVESLQQILYSESEELRVNQHKLDTMNLLLSEEYEDFKQGYVELEYLSDSGEISTYEKQSKLAIHEIITSAYDISQFAKLSDYEI